MESSSNRISLLLEANLRFLSATLQQNSLVLNTLTNSNSLDENQNILNNLLNWLKSLNHLPLTSGETVLIDALKDSVRKAKSIDIIVDKKNSLSLVSDFINEKPSDNIIQTKEEQFQISEELVSSEGIIDSNTESSQSDLEEVPSSFFFRRNKEEDRWNYLSTIKSFIDSYEHLMHLLIPNLVFETVYELHRYDGQNQIILSDAVSYPTLLLQNLITKFLREAPGSNLFRKIRRVKLDNEVDLSFEQAVNIGERQNIRNLIKNYFDILTQHLENSESPVSIDSLLERTRNNFKQFSLGPASVEMRLTAVIKHVTDASFSDAEEAIKNDNASLKTKVIYLASTLLLCDFQNFLLNEPRIVKFLEDLKG